MRPIDADTLMPSFIKKANTLKDRHGVKLGEDWLLDYEDIKDVIDNAPTICERYRSFCMVKPERPQRGFTIDELKLWLYEIADNNNNDFGNDCLEIVDRLDGFWNFVTDMRKEAENDK